MNNNNSIKDHYIKIQELYSNAVNILTAINQSFQSSSSEITVKFLDTDDTEKTVRIPSFMWLESRVEQLDANMNNLFKIPKSGEAWFSKSSDMYKLELVKSNNAPVTPQISSDKLYAKSKDTYIFKDLVNPKTFLKFNIDNLPDNIKQMSVKKIIFFTRDLFDQVKAANPTKYDDYVALLYNKTKGIDYEEYDTIVDLPLHQDEYVSEFKIMDIPQGEEDNPYTDENSKNLIYKVVLDTLTYSKEEDSSIEFTLQPGQYVCLDDQYCIYRVLSTKSINNDIKQHEVILEEVNGHISLQTFEENSGMVLHIYNQDYSKYHYVEVPLEENPYVAFFLSTIYNNTRSVYSDGVLLNMNEIVMLDENGNKMISNGKEISYIEYYNKYCTNIGDLLLGISNVAYPQLTNYTNANLFNMQNGDDIKQFVSNTINTNILKVQKINEHLIDDNTSKKIISLNSKKNELTNELNSVQSNIDTIYNQLVTVDFLNNTAITQISLKSQLDDLYQKRIQLQKEIISIVDNIKTLKASSQSSKNKFRIRGNVDVAVLENYVKNNFNKCNIIKMELQYKYKSATLDTTNVTNINSNLFTDWNILPTIEKERRLEFDSMYNTYELVYENYDSNTNIIKWNQVDIPIQQGEDVVIRVRFKYSVGQPFINLYTPWSDEVNIEFPLEFYDANDIETIFNQNESDEIEARFNKTLINEGYEEHISNKIIDNSQVYFHMPENIYSGFNTPENKFISLKDKLQSLNNDVEKYKEMILSEITSEYKIYLNYEDKSIELLSNVDNNINISNTENLFNDTYNTKQMYITVKNTGNTPLKLYSLFPGNSDKYLIQLSDNDAQIQRTDKYERVPILIEGDSTSGLTSYDTASYQSLGQWIYFKEVSNYSMESYYLNTFENNYNVYTNLVDYLKKKKQNPNASLSLTNNYLLDEYINTPKQILMPYRYRKYHNLASNNSLLPIYQILDDILNSTDLNNDKKKILQKLNTNIFLDNSEIDNYYESIDFGKEYKFTNNYLENRFILRYEHIYGYQTNSNIILQLNNQKSLSSFLDDQNNRFNLGNENTKLTSTNLIGGFLVPNLTDKSQILCNEKNNSYITVNVGESISLPILFEYYLPEAPQYNNTLSEGSEIKSITKILSFDIQNTLLRNPINYILKIKATYDVSNNIYSSSSIDLSNDTANQETD